MQYVLLSMLVGALFGGGMAIAQSSDNAVRDNKKPRYLAKFEEQFKAADKDHDGALTRTEAESAGMMRVVDNFDRLDTDRDGKITPGEMRALVRSKLSS